MEKAHAATGSLLSIPGGTETTKSRKEKVKENDNIELLNETAVNVRIMLNHLLDSYGQYERLYREGAAYPMGNNIDKRFLTVIECQVRK